MAPDQKAKRAQRPPSPKREIVDQKVIKALAHPVRAQALAILNERVASPNEIAQELDQGVGHISYHINVLKECECIELVETVPRRGAVEHFYRATTRAFLGDEDWRRLPPSVRPTLSATLMQDLVDDAAASLSAGTFDARDDRHFSWTPMIVDEQGWAEVVEVYRSALGRVLEIQAASADRLTRKEESGTPISVAAMVYETPGR
jgi:DNA-binding transcriptional ArsR family regulator